MEKLKKQIIFSDYDGTIYITEESMSKNIKSIEEYRTLGGKFVIVTGRSKTSASNVIKQYNIPYDYIISNNGSVIYNEDMEKIYEQAITPEVTNEILEYLKDKENIELFFYDDRDKIEYNGQKLLKLRIKTPDYNLARKLEDEINSIFKNNVKAHATSPGLYYDNIKHALLDIVSRKAGKENAIKKLLALLNIPKESAVTIGDGRNDVEMIKEYSGYSMKTAEEEAKIVASKLFEGVSDIVEYLKR